MLLLQDPSRNTQQPFFYLREFLDWLFSSCNGLLEPAKKSVYQDMSRPLAHYWISSSHNTYLTGGHQGNKHFCVNMKEKLNDSQYFEQGFGSALI
jgi:hypothetical protein